MMFVQSFYRTHVHIYAFIIFYLIRDVQCPYQQQCDGRLLRNCQQNILTNIQETFQNQRGDTIDFQTDRRIKCGAVRRDLYCVIQNNPICQRTDLSSSEFNSVDIILRAKSYLDNNCDSFGGWRISTCYLRSDIRQCETQFGFQSTTAVTTTSCTQYLSFENCVTNIIRYQCMSHDLDLIGEYFIDKAQQLSWSCVPQSHRNSYVENNYQSFTSSYDSGSNINRDRNFDSQNGRNQIGTNFNRFGTINRFGSSAALNSDSCQTRANNFVSICDDMLIQRQRDIRNGGNIQLNMCCPLLLYRDCLNRVVIDRCPDTPLLAVDLLMGSRRREELVNCMDFTRDLCNDSLIVKQSANLLIFVILWIIYYNFNNF